MAKNMGFVHGAYRHGSCVTYFFTGFAVKRDNFTFVENFHYFGINECGIQLLAFDNYVGTANQHDYFLKVRY